MTNVTLLGRVIITGHIRTLTGLHIGGSPGALAIGNVDMPVIRDAVTGRPYIPGSSLKGKMRSLAEKVTGAPQNKSIGKDVTIHVAEDRAQYDRYWVNPLFGIPGEVKFDVPAPNRLIVRDVPLWDKKSLSLENAQGKSAEELLAIHTDLPYTEVKWEAAIDRVTSAATPRQMERVPAGAVFAPMEIVFSLYLRDDVSLLSHLFTSLQMVEDDFLGGQGSRGSGKVCFEGLQLVFKSGGEYRPTYESSCYEAFEKLLVDRNAILEQVKQAIPLA
jgi:CRISPR-associated protein Csm3